MERRGLCGAAVNNTADAIGKQGGQRGVANCRAVACEVLKKCTEGWAIAEDGVQAGGSGCERNRLRSAFS